jgi:phage terminase large subunit-like protein
MLLDGEIRHSNHPVLTMCAANAIAKGDEAGNRKLDKKRSTGRIDGLVALTMAVAIAAEMMSDPVYPIELGSVLEA